MLVRQCNNISKNAMPTLFGFFPVSSSKRVIVFGFFELYVVLALSKLLQFCQGAHILSVFAKVWNVGQKNKIVLGKIGKILFNLLCISGQKIGQPSL